ncbi:MAG: hypothetical protein ACKOAG_05045, partial [Candidatus Kapaibacterium sp.]
MKKFDLSSIQWLVACLLLAVAFTVSPHAVVSDGGDGFDEDHDARREWERLRLCDPATGRIPRGMRARELAFAAGLPSRETLLRERYGARWMSVQQ